MYRIAIAHSLASVDGVDVVAKVADGQQALKAITQHTPDVMILDLEMPVMSGLETLTQLVAGGWTGKHPQIIIFSSHNPEGAEITMKALNKGAVDFIPKPKSNEGMAHIETVLVPKLLALANNLSKVHLAARKPHVATDDNTPRAILAIASSTGGPNALKAAFQPFPADFPIPIMVVQHMPPVFTASMANHLNNRLALTVVEAKSGIRPAAGTVYIAPGDFHMTLTCGIGYPVIRLHQKPAVGGLRPFANTLFTGLAQGFGAKVLAAVFTGMGEDGADGCKSLADQGAAILTQTPESCVVASMPNATNDLVKNYSDFSPETFYKTVSQFNLTGRLG